MSRSSHVSVSDSHDFPADFLCLEMDQAWLIYSLLLRIDEAIPFAPEQTWLLLNVAKLNAHFVFPAATSALRSA